jgi:hypothetical protein
VLYKIIFFSVLAVASSAGLWIYAPTVLKVSAPMLQLQYSFIKHASDATWTNENRVLQVWNLNEVWSLSDNVEDNSERVEQIINSNNGAVVYVNNENVNVNNNTKPDPRYWRGRLLEDGFVWPEYLITHPQQVPNGIIEGKYGPFTLIEGTAIYCEVGFLKGSRQSAEWANLIADGVSFKIYFESASGSDREILLDQRALDDGHIDKFTAELNRFAGKEGFIILSTDAGRTFWTDYAVWKGVRVISTRK